MKKFKNKTTNEIYNVSTPTIVSQFESNDQFEEIKEKNPKKNVNETKKENE